jgi:replicative DNA helicase
MNPLHDTAAERAVLGAVLLMPEAIHDLVEVLTPEDFAKEAHRVVFAAMQRLAVKREPIDTFTVTDELKAAGDLGSAGGMGGLALLEADVPSSANFARYAQTVRDLALRRRLVERCATLLGEAQDLTRPITETLQAAEASIHAVADSGVGPKQLQPISGAIRREWVALQQLFERQTDITGTATGLAELDALTTGMHEGELWILAGRPAMGKTALAMGIASHVAHETKKPVVVFEQEMSEGSLVRRLLASEGRVSGQRIKTGRFDDADWPKLARAADRLNPAKLFIDDTPGATVLDMRSRCRRVRQKHGEIALVVVDYIGLMRSSERTENREQAVAEFSRGLKGLARELSCPVLALSQLNRGVEKQSDKRPGLADLRESGAIEQDADLVAFVYRDEVYNKETKDKGVAEIIVQKQRNGPIGVAKVAFQSEFTRFEDLRESWP